MNIVTLGDFSQTLQLLTFQIYCKAMQKTLASLFLATSLLVGGVTASVAAEPVRKSEDQQSFFERYTNAAQDVILQGLKLVGVRYRFGGNDEINGLDCSGFVRLVFKNSIGASLPRTAREMSEVGEQVDASQLKPGDLVFFNTMRKATNQKRRPCRFFYAKEWRISEASKPASSRQSACNCLQFPDSREY